MLAAGGVPRKKAHAQLTFFVVLQAGIYELPFYVSPNVADLVKQMLRVNPHKRIAMVIQSTLLARPPAHLLKPPSHSPCAPRLSGKDSLPQGLRQILQPKYVAPARPIPPITPNNNYGTHADSHSHTRTRAHPLNHAITPHPSCGLAQVDGRSVQTQAAGVECRNVL